MRQMIFVSIPYSGHEDVFPERCRKAHERHDSEGVVFTPQDIINDSSMPYSLCMGKTIERLLECNRVIFADGWADSRGCNLEHRCAEIYGIEISVDARI